MGGREIVIIREHLAIEPLQDPAVVRTILAHLGLSGAADPPGPAPPAPAAMP